MASVIYNGAAIIPAPFVSIASNPVIAGDQRRLGKTYTLTINGTLTSLKGSPQGGSFSGPGWGGINNLFWIDSGYPPDETSLIAHQMYNIQIKQQALEDLFATDGAFLEFDSPDGSAPMKAQIKNAVVTFAEGNWVQTCPYTIVCECDYLYLNGETYQGISFSELIQSSTESWEFQPNEVVKTFNVTHTVSAVGKRTFDDLGNLTQDSWQTARDFVNQNLVLGFAGTSVFSSNGGQSIFNQSSLASGVIDFSSLSPFDFARVETTDELGGAYSVTESWLLANATSSGTNIFTVSVNQIVEEPYTTTQATIQGIIKGFYINLFDYDERIAAAEYMWSQLQPTGLWGLVEQYAGSTYASGVAFNVEPVGAVIDYNINEGSLSYNYTFNNRLQTGDVFENYTVSRKTTVEDYKSQFTIGGQIKGRKYITDTDPTLAFTRANAWWNQIYPMSGGYTQPQVFYSRIVSNVNFPEASGMGLRLSPIDRNIDKDPANGVINYSFTFDNRFNPSGVDVDSVREEYSIDQHFSREDGITTYTINGVVVGLNTSDLYPQVSKWEAASGYFYTYVQPNLYNRIQNYYQVNLPNPLYQSLEIQSQITLGVLTYGFGFNNLFPPLLPNALSETIRINESNPSGYVSVIGNIPIIGRGSGPILQNMSTTVVKQRSVSVEVVVQPTGGPSILAAFAAKPNYDAFLLPLAPANSYLENDQSDWDYRHGRYSRNLSWIYE